MSADHPAIAFVASKTGEAQAALAALRERYTEAPLDKAEIIVALGGDGFMLRTLHRHMAVNRPVYGMKLGTVGFLMNQFHADNLTERLARAQPTTLKPLVMQAVSESGNTVTSLAFNEVSLLRQTKQAAHIRVAQYGERFIHAPAQGRIGNVEAHLDDQQSTRFGAVQNGGVQGIDHDVAFGTRGLALRTLLRRIRRQACTA